MGLVGKTRRSSTNLETLRCRSQVVVVVDATMEMDLRTELETANFPANLELLIYPVPSEQASTCLSAEDTISRKADLLLTDAVFFVGRTVSDASRWYTWWLRHCNNRLAVGQPLPTAHVHCVASQVSLAEIQAACSQRFDADVIVKDHLVAQTFRQLTVCTGSGVAPLMDIMQIAQKASQIRRSLNTAWSSTQARRIREAYLSHLRSGKNTMFRVSPALSWARFTRNNTHSALHVLFANNQHRLEHPDFAKVLTSYVCVGEGVIGTLADGLRRNTQTRPQRSDAIVKQTPRQLRQKAQALIPQMSSLTDPIQSSLESCLVRGLLRWGKVTRDSIRTRAGAQHWHICNLAKHSDFLRSQEYGPLCLICISRPWQLLLQCGRHGTCYQCRNSLRKSHGRTCFVCNLPGRKLQPKESHEYGRGRVLALDGGGVRGHIQLEVLALLEREIGLDLPLRCFFDLIIGTSIGGIVALGLGVKQWSIAECQTKLTDLSSKIFKQRSKVTSSLAKITKGWSETFIKAAKVYWYDSIYDWRLLEKVLRDAFGSDDLLAANGVNSVKVAVTATTGSNPPCTIFTNYDKSRHTKESAYEWPDAAVASRVKIWEAARCTSAAPVYFSTKVLFGEAFYDGGMFHNNPNHLGRHEASVLFQCPAEDNLVVSVGCGDLRVAPGGSSSLSRLWETFAQKLRPAKEEEIRALWGADRRNYERLDPKLDMPEIPLDNLQLMLDAIPQIRTSLSQSEALQEKIRSTAWKLVATTFYAAKIDSVRVRGQLQMSLHIDCRLGEEVWRIWRKWPDAHLSIDGKPLRRNRQDAKFSIRTSCVPMGHHLDVRLNAYGRSESISGFPIPVILVPGSNIVEDTSRVLGKRKRS